MIPALLLVIAGQTKAYAFPHVPETNWAYETMFRAGRFAQYPGIGSVRFIIGNYPVSRKEAAKAWFEGFTAVRSRHTKYYKEHIYQTETPGRYDIYPLETHRLDKENADILQQELDFIYDGLYRMQLEFREEINAMTNSKNQDAIEFAKLDLSVIRMESEMPLKLGPTVKKFMDLRDAVLSEGR